MLSSLGQFRLAVKQLLPGAEESFPTRRQQGNCELAFQHLYYLLERVNGPALGIVRKAWGYMRSLYSQ